MNSKAALLEESVAPNQYQVLVTCIFLNKTNRSRAEGPLKKFLIKYPSPRHLKDIEVKDIEVYFETLGLQSRARWIQKMATQLIEDPPMPHIMRKKNNGCESYECEVAHLSGVGPYACDAWRLFCKKQFYLQHGFNVEEEWKILAPKNEYLKSYVARILAKELDDPAKSTASLMPITEAGSAPDEQNTLRSTSDQNLDRAHFNNARTSQEPQDAKAKLRETTESPAGPKEINSSELEGHDEVCLAEASRGPVNKFQKRNSSGKVTIREKKTSSSRLESVARYLAGRR